jgi:hypothetical protein
MDVRRSSFKLRQCNDIFMNLQWKPMKASVRMPGTLSGVKPVPPVCGRLVRLSVSCHGDFKIRKLS